MKDSGILIFAGVAVALYLLYENLSTTCAASTTGLCSIYNSLFPPASALTVPMNIPSGANVIPATAIPVISTPALSTASTPTASQNTLAASLAQAASVSSSTMMTPAQWDYVLSQIAPSAVLLNSASVQPVTAASYVAMRVSAGMNGLGFYGMTSYTRVA
jgi:hypothetical protein